MLSFDKKKALVVSAIISFFATNLNMCAQCETEISAGLMPVILKMREQNLSKPTDEQNDVESKKLIKVPYINQNDIVYGCEAVSATMILQYYGYNISAKDFTDNYLIKKNWTVSSDGQSYGPSPYSAYPGNPYKDSGINCGFGSFAPSTAKSIDKVLDSTKHETKVTTGMNLVDLATNYIDKNIPVLVWATMDMKETKEGFSWIVNYIDENSPYKIGDKFTWMKGEHCLVLVGYDNDNYYFNDPYKNHGLIGYSKSLVNQRFLELGKQSIVILKK